MNTEANIIPWKLRKGSECREILKSPILKPFVPFHSSKYQRFQTVEFIKGMRNYQNGN